MNIFLRVLRSQQKHRALISVLISALTFSIGYAEPKTGFRYQVEEVNHVSQTKTTVLVPKVFRVTGRNQEAQLNTLFRAMQQASRSIYGNAKIAFKRNGEQVTEIHVWLDQSKSIYFDLVISETVFTFTEMGFEGVYFPEVRPVRVGRSDIAFGVFSLSLRPWELLQSTSPLRWTDLANGIRINAQEMQSRVEKRDPELIKRLWADFELSDEAALAVLSVASSHRFEGRQTRCLSSLESISKDIRKQALKCLETLEPSEIKIEQISAYLENEPEPEIYDQAIQIFRGMKSAKVRMTVLVRETQHDAEERALNAVAALIDEKGSEATKHLEQLTLNDKAPIAIAAIEGLLKRGELAGLAATLRESKVPNTRRLVIAKRLLQKEKFRTIAGEVILSLGTSADQEAIKPLWKTLKESERILWYTRGLDNEAPKVRADIYARISEEKSRGLALWLAKRNTDSQPDKVNETRLLSLICNRLPTKVQFAEIKSKTSPLNQCAMKALSAKSRSEKTVAKKLIPVLRKRLKSKTSEIRADSLLALAYLGRSKDFGLVKAAAKDASPIVVAAAASSLRYFPKSDTLPILRELQKRQEPEILAGVCRSYGELAHPEGIEVCRALFDRKEEVLRIETTRALAKLVGKLGAFKTAFELFSGRLNDENPEVRQLGLMGINEIDDPRKITTISFLVQDPNISVRTQSIVLLGQSKDVKAVEPLESGLAATEKTIRLATINALISIGNADAKNALKRHLEREEDEALKARIRTNL